MVRIFGIGSSGRVPKCWATAAPCLRKRAVSSPPLDPSNGIFLFYAHWPLLWRVDFVVVGPVLSHSTPIIPFMRHIGLYLMTPQYFLFFNPHKRYSNLLQNFNNVTKIIKLIVYSNFMNVV